MAEVGFFSPSQEEIYAVLKSIERLIASKNKRREIIEHSLEVNGFLVHYTD